MDLDLADRFDRLEEKLDGVEKNLGGRLDRVEEELRHVHVVVEDNRSLIQTVAEGVVCNDQKIGVLRAEMNERFEDLEGVLQVSVRALERRMT